MIAGGGAFSVAGLGAESLGRGWGVMWFHTGTSLPPVEMVILRSPPPPARVSWGSSLKHRFCGLTTGPGDVGLGSKSIPRRQEEPGSEKDAQPSCRGPISDLASCWL